MLRHGNLFTRAALNVTDSAISVVASLIATPFLIRGLHVEAYGLFVVFSAFCGPTALFELGLGQAVTKFVSEFLALRQSRGANDIVNSAVLIQLAYAAVIGGALYCSRTYLLRVLNVPSGLRQDAALCLLLSPIGVCIQLFSTTLASATMGLQRYDVTLRVNSFVNVIVAVLSGSIAILTGRLFYVVLISCLLPLFAVSAYAVFLHQSEMRFRPSYLPHGRTIRKLLSFGSGVFLMKASQLVANLGTRLIISALVGPVGVTIFAVPQKLVNGLGGFLSSAAAVTLPFASEEAASRDTKRLEIAAMLALKTFAAVALPGMLLAIYLAPDLLSAWVGRELAIQTATIGRILLVAATLGAMSCVPTLFAMGKGEVRLIALFSITATVTLLLSLGTLVRHFGPLGAAVAATVSSITWVVFSHHVCKSTLGIDMQTYYRQCTLVPGATGAGLVVLTSMARRLIPFQSSYGSVAAASAMFILYLGFYVFVHRPVAGSPRTAGCGPDTNAAPRQVNP
jgi:O-antigen/teichoic acid export membrane protein